ncbi:hypothetical protein [Streptomyces sp. NPDC051572]|uniref:hypothetical protein n=1 Tax=unclassified Streptomyces TaxID=2593676 RepID=UPI00344D415E
MLAHIYVDNSPVAYVILLAVCSPLALAALAFITVELVPSLRRYSLVRDKEPIDRKFYASGCLVMALAMSGMVAWGIWGLFRNL